MRQKSESNSEPHDHHLTPTYGETPQNSIVGEFLIQDTRHSTLLMSKAGEKALLNAPSWRLHEIGD
jgi:hypothetical protein